MWTFLEKHKTILNGLLFAILVTLIYYCGWRDGSNDAKQQCAAERIAMQQKAQQQAFNASEKYKKTKAEQQKEKEIQYVEIEKIITRDVYRNVCLDDNGVQQLNAAITQ